MVILTYQDAILLLLTRSRKEHTMTYLNETNTPILGKIAKSAKAQSNDYDKLFADGSREADFRSPDHIATYGNASWKATKDTIAKNYLTTSEYALVQANTKDLDINDKTKKRIYIQKVSGVIGRIARALADRANLGVTKENTPLTLNEITLRFIIAFKKKANAHDGDTSELIASLEEFHSDVKDFDDS